MKVKKTIQLTLALLFLLSITAYSQNIGINDDGSSPDASAILDVKSNSGDKGMLLPRLTNAQKNAISSPATGLIIYQTDAVPGFYYYNSSNWVKLSNEKITYATVAEAEAATGIDNDLCFVVETETHYRYEATASNYSDDDKYVLATSDAGDTRWLGISGKYNLGDYALDEIVHLDATSGSATITDLNKVYYIASATTTTTITIPDANAENEGWFLRLYKESGVGVINFVTTSGQIIDGATQAQVVYSGNGLFVKSDNEMQWLCMQDSRVGVPVVESRNSDYAATESWQFDFLILDTDAGNLTATAPASMSIFPEGARRMIFNTGSNIVYADPNGNAFDGSTEQRMIGPSGYIELQKLDGKIKSIREKNISIKKCADDIANLEVWLDASVLAGVDGGSIASWTDIENSHAFTGAAINQPTLQTNQQNGKNIVRFDGTNDVLSAGDIEMHDNSRGFTIVAVVRPDINKRMPIIGKYNTSGDNRQYAFGDGTNYLFEDGTWGAGTNCFVTLKQAKFQIVEYVWEPGKNVVIYINGVQQCGGSGGVNDIYDGTSNLKLGGADYTYAGFWDGDIAEVIIYSDAVSDSERELLRDNLSVKWDIDEIIIANGGAKYWKRDGNTNTVSPDVNNDNLDIGTGTYTGASADIDTMTVNDLFNAPSSSTAPGNPQGGSVYYDTDDNQLMVYNAGTSTWDYMCNTRNKITKGYVDVGDIGGTSGVLSIGGNITSASATTTIGTSTITVNFTDQGSLLYVPMLSFHSMGTLNDDNDLEEPIIFNRTTSSFQIYLDETLSVLQNLRVYIMIMPY
jgi:Concanavalin A-like lectin/glucanases superfamily